MRKQNAKLRVELRRFSEHLQTAVENDRMEVAREIHDDLGQACTAIGFALARLKGIVVDGSEGDAASVLDDIHARIGGIARSAMRICRRLRPPMLDDLGLVAAVEWMVSEFQERTAIQCHVLAPDETLSLGEKVAICLYRTIQEALTNVARHSEATDVWIDMAKNSGVVELVVRDNGRGLTQDDLSRPDSFGLIGIRERVRALNGDFEVDSSPGKGVTLVVRVAEDGKAVGSSLCMVGDE